MSTAPLYFSQEKRENRLKMHTEPDTAATLQQAMSSSCLSEEGASKLSSPFLLKSQGLCGLLNDGQCASCVEPCNDLCPSLANKPSAMTGALWAKSRGTSAVLGILRGLLGLQLFERKSSAVWLPCVRCPFNALCAVACDPLAMLLSAELD